MAIAAPKVLFGPVQVGATDGTLYTSAGNTFTTVTRCVFTNTDTATQTITVNVVRSGGSVATSNQVIAAMALASGQAYVSPELAGLILAAGDFISAKASTGAKINAVGSGYTS